LRHCQGLTFQPEMNTTFLQEVQDAGKRERALQLPLKYPIRDWAFILNIEIIPSADLPHDDGEGVLSNWK
jgi:hypothetical protein